MKKLLFLVIFFLSVKTFADAGYAYRFYIKAEVKGKEVKGYFYHYSYDKFDVDRSFYEYLKKTIHNRDINIFKEIVTVNLNSNYDFALKDSDLSFELKDLNHIELLETLIFLPNSRLIKLTNKEFEIINCSKVNYKFVIEEGEISFFENCSYVIISLESVDSMMNRKITIEKLIKDKIKNLGGLKEDNYENYYSYFKQLREELLKEKVLLISVCSPL
ncbi:hypothetical protein H3Z83_08130 [Tenacibaculum sp. S7007]|uniref:Uncharacterized protein n=1 Tax=Tenacibaculum pelagium TaxID=2759527 RepID=A0A839APL9_9FLAO|nr:hypothetical protein [Tenacibaculum pelagium]MBA6156477.1 hypothetical protein [Tenacibaculum pelagium]